MVKDVPETHLNAWPLALQRLDRRFAACASGGSRHRALALFLTALAAACARTVEAPLEAEAGCRSCHGGQSTSAPPRGLTGDDPTDLGVGTHQSHVLGGALRRPVSCSECHLVPKASDDPGHTDTALPAEVIFGPLARTVPAAPIWDRRAATCGGTYCHGATLGGGTNKVPKWTVVDGSQSGCGTCHGLPPPAPHPASDACEVCHSPVAGPGMEILLPYRHVDGTLDVVGAGSALDLADPGHDLTLLGLIPTYDGTSISLLTPLSQTLKMPMRHATNQIAAAALSACDNCHPGAPDGSFFPGLLHVSLDDLSHPQPNTCSECHAASQPRGFVGSIAAAPARDPPSGEMKHDAVLWANDAPTTTRAVPADCALCHLSGLGSSWASGAEGGPVRFHASLAAQPSSCVDCHANSRPALLSAANAALPAGLVLDHRQPQVMGDCQVCHAASAPAFERWSGGRFHQAGASTPDSCLPCHEAERPSGDAGWSSATYRDSPFDYGTNAQGIPHGGGQDCVGCHAGPGTGQWGAIPNWAQGHFAHGPSTLAATVCINCHTTQRPDLLPGATAGSMAALLGFDHSTNGRGDCIGCHQATVTRGRYVDLYDASGVLPGGDWRGGTGYPGSTLVASTSHSFSVTEIVLNRSGPNGWISGSSQRTSTYFNSMLHASPAMPPEVNAGPSGSPDASKCWHCHTNDNGVVTSLADGAFHASLATYRARVGDPVTPLSQPSRCRDCHTAVPQGIVEEGGSTLQPMDHAAAFTAAVSIGGVMAASVEDLECSACHRSEVGSSRWAGGKFHENIGAATPADCSGCHYPLLADAPKADVTRATRFVMRHRSAQVTIQRCDQCHGAALRQATAPFTAARWQTGDYHGSIGAQPATCGECHSVSKPAAATASSISYAVPQGATSTNQSQWMNHASPQLAGKDCSACHAGDAKTTGSAWSKSTRFHDAVTNASTCRECHGLTNGGGSVPGTNNNLPAALDDSATITSASSGAGVPAGTHDQIAHSDVNVTANDCKLCHRQQGVSTTPGIQGAEWAQASFHRSFTLTRPLVLNGGTGRCSHCHMNVKPGSTYSGQDHRAFTESSAQDCADCHSWPGTNPTSPNWLGATGAHSSSGPTGGSSLDCNTCHGQGGTASKRLAVPAADHFGGVTNGNACVSCHVNFSGFTGTTLNLKYAHTNASANGSGCVTCHAFNGQLLTTLTTTPALNHPTTSGGHQFSQTLTVTGSYDGDSFSASHTNAKLGRCGACHQYSATTASSNIWAFKHRPSNPGISNSKSSGGCNMCH